MDTLQTNLINLIYSFKHLSDKYAEVFQIIANIKTTKTPGIIATYYYALYCAVENPILIFETSSDDLFDPRDIIINHILSISKEDIKEKIGWNARFISHYNQGSYYFDCLDGKNKKFNEIIKNKYPLFKDETKFILVMTGFSNVSFRGIHLNSFELSSVAFCLFQKFLKVDEKTLWLTIDAIKDRYQEIYFENIENANSFLFFSEPVQNSSKFSIVNPLFYKKNGALFKTLDETEKIFELS